MCPEKTDLKETVIKKLMEKGKNREQAEKRFNEMTLKERNDIAGGARTTTLLKAEKKTVR